MPGHLSENKDLDSHDDSSLPVFNPLDNGVFALTKDAKVLKIRKIHSETSEQHPSFAHPRTHTERKPYE